MTGRWTVIASACATIAALASILFGTSVWHAFAACELKAAALALACLLATPYVLDYDLMVLPIAIAFLARHGFANGFHVYEISLPAAVWFVPLIARGVIAATARASTNTAGRLASA